MSHCSKQVLILNITRMGDLAQTVPLLRRLEEESPGVAIDLVIDTRLAPMAELLPGLRHIHTYDFKNAFNHAPNDQQESAPLSSDIAAWARSLATVGYDRVVNLTFTRWSGLLAAAIGAPDTRGVTVGQNGAAILRNPWLTHVVDLHQHRRFNRFNLVDLYALGGSGPGAFTPIHLKIPREAEQWARQFVETRIQNQIPVAVQIGASHPLKAWRAESFGRTMAAMNRERNVAFVLNSPKNEVDSVQQAVRAYRQAGGMRHACNIIEDADVPQLAAVLQRCRLLLTNDTGPMHLAVGVGTPVIDLSVGHVDFRETGPYGPGHWVVQPIMDCAPCSYQQVCAHQNCRDQIVPEQVAQLCLHVLGYVEFPTAWSGVQVYKSDIDEDGLACYRLKAGQSDSVTEWYGSFWRRYWYETFTGRVSRVACDQSAPDHAEQQQRFAQLLPALNRAVDLADQIAIGSRHQPMPIAMLHHAQTELTTLRNQIMPLAMSSPASGPIAVLFLRQLSQCESDDVVQVADHQANAYRNLKIRMCTAMERLRETCNEDSVQHPIAELSQGIRGLRKKELVNNGS